jgi:uncharacterized protein YcsI (UPF0317 family)
MSKLRISLIALKTSAVRNSLFDIRFLLFCVRNPRPCPILDVLEPGVTAPAIAPGADLRTDLLRSILGFPLDIRRRFLYG